MKSLHLIDSLDYNSSAKQLHVLGSRLANHGTPVEICCLGPETPWSQSLRERGVTVHALGWTRWFDFGAWWNLREIVRDGAPDLIHVWRMPYLTVLLMREPPKRGAMI